MTEIDELTIHLESTPGIAAYISEIPLLKKVGIDEDRKLNFSIRPNNAYLPGLQELMIYSFNSNKKYLLGTKKIIVIEKDPPQIIETNYGLEKIWEAEKDKFESVSFKLKDSSGIDFSGIKAFLNGITIENINYSSSKGLVELILSENIRKKLNRVNTLDFECPDHFGNKLNAEFRIKINYRISDYFTLIGLILIVLFYLLFLKLKGNWECSSCGTLNMWNFISCSKCKSRRKGSIIFKYTVPLIIFLSAFFKKTYKLILDFSIDLKEKYHIQRIHRKLIKNLSELGREILIYVDSIPEYRHDESVIAVLGKYFAGEERMSAIEKTMSDMRKRGESGDYYSHRGESLWNFAISINAAAEEIEAIKNELRCLEIELGRSAYFKIKGGTNMPGRCSDIAADIFAMEKELVVSGISSRDIFFFESTKQGFSNDSSGSNLTEKDKYGQK
jgi:hypothetical protein